MTVRPIRQGPLVLFCSMLDLMSTISQQQSQLCKFYDGSMHTIGRGNNSSWVTMLCAVARALWQGPACTWLPAGCCPQTRSAATHRSLVMTLRCAASMQVDCPAQPARPGKGLCTQVEYMNLLVKVEGVACWQAAFCVIAQIWSQQPSHSQLGSTWSCAGRSPFSG